MSLPIYPHVKEVLTSQGQQNIIVAQTAVRKLFGGKYYLIPIVEQQPIVMLSKEEARINALQSLHERAYRVIQLQTFKDLQTPEGLLAALDPNQLPESNRIAMFYGLSVPDVEFFEDDDKGGVKLVEEKAKPSVRANQKPASRNAAKGKGKPNSKEDPKLEPVK